ncbi:MAG: hypothetical protein ABIV63_03565 [Caldimonas sp.]
MTSESSPARCASCFSIDMRIEVTGAGPMQTRIDAAAKRRKFLVKKTICDTRSRLCEPVAVILGMLATSVSAQVAPQAPSAVASDPNPYYIGVSQALTHDSNVYRTPSGPSDNYSSTTLLGGFDQPISRQRIFGGASVSLNRYQDQTQLNNTSYNLNAGLDWQTVQSLSGNVNVGINRNLAAPAASGVIPVATRNESTNESAGTVVRWGGASLLSVEGAASYSKVNYSAPQYVSSESSQDSESLGLYYRPGGPLRLGVAVRTTRSRSPNALLLSNGAVQSNNTRGNNLDLIVDYDLTGLITTNARLSYTRQTNSGISSADFSGITGNLNVSYRPTGKTSVSAYASRDTGFNNSLFNGYTVTLLNGVTPILTPVSGLYENNQITNSLGLGLTYAATAKISATTGVRYARAKLITTLVTQSSSQASPDTTDISKNVYLGANYAIARNWALACNVSHENRDVSGAVTYSYTANTASCLAQYTWR